MGFLKNLFNKLQKKQDATELPAHIELVANKLWVSIAVHQIPATMGNSSLKALSFLTKGLESKGQQELFFVLKTNHTEIDNVPKEPLYFFQQVYNLAQQGQFAREGSITQFGEKDLWGWKGIVYAKAPTHLSQLPPNCLCMILLSLEEVQAVQTFGYARILSMLGKQTRYYPFPYWVDHYRENLLIKELKDSFLSKVRRIVIAEATVTCSNHKHIYLTIRKTLDRSWAQESFSSDTPLAILPSLSTEADSCLTWSFQTNKPEAITLPNSKGQTMGGCLLLIIGNQKENIARIVEDGFAVMLTNTEWERFWNAIKQQHLYKMEASGTSLNFSLVWI